MELRGRTPWDIFLTCWATWNSWDTSARTLIFLFFWPCDFKTQLCLLDPNLQLQELKVTTLSPQHSKSVLFYYLLVYFFTSPATFLFLSGHWTSNCLIPIVRPSCKPNHNPNPSYDPDLCSNPNLISELNPIPSSNPMPNCWGSVGICMYVRTSIQHHSLAILFLQWLSSCDLIIM